MTCHHPIISGDTSTRHSRPGWASVSARALPALLKGLALAGLLVAQPSCGYPAHAPASAQATVETDDDAIVGAFERKIADTIAKVRGSAVALEYSVADAPTGIRRVATGLILNDEGHVLSIRIDPPPPQAPIVARDASGKRHRAEWLAVDPETGLTLLRIKPIHARPIRPAKQNPRLGSQVLVIGNPFGLGHSVIRGQVAGLDRRVDIGPRPLGGLIQIDAALHPGDSGAVVANLHGEWLGLVRSGLAAPGSERVLDHDLGFAIPARDALWIADQLHTRRRVDRAYLGVRLNAEKLGDQPGAILDGVLVDSPAAQAGLRKGDRVMALDGHAIESPGDLTDQLDRTLANTEATIEYQRGAFRDHLVVRTGCRPPLPSSSATPSSPSPPAEKPKLSPETPTAPSPASSPVPNVSSHEAKVIPIGQEP
ncbi:S1C family serine protease [Singulisphaera sp. PoT]|uniref:S1C family serine protease n=1 Tax=Singulisphaera sp. PoT TaxID=3411797 RepID=UPI003BF58AC2